MLYERVSGLVSVVITNFNNSLYLKECLDSLIDQTYRNIEIILVDDASTDQSIQIINQWIKQNTSRFPRNDYFTLIQLPRNIGYAGALTTGLFSARGEYIAVLDGDDFCHLERFERQVQFLINHPDHGLVGGNYQWFPTENPKELHSINWLRYGDSSIREIYRQGQHCIAHGTILFRGHLFDQAGGPSRRIRGAEDYEFIIKLLPLTKVDNLKNVLVYYRMHPHQRSRQFYGKKDKDRHD